MNTDIIVTGTKYATTQYSTLLDIFPIFIYNLRGMIAQMQLEKIKVISFDGDMTLWDFFSVMRHSLQYTLTALRNRFPGPATDQLTIDKMISIRNSTAAELKGSEGNLEKIRYQAFRHTLEYVGIEDDAFAETLNALYLKHRFEDIELYHDVLPALTKLKQYYKLGLCSNGNNYPERCGLSGIFSFTVFAQDVGVEKPDKHIFLEACRQADCTPANMMHIGDSLSNDVAGAQRVGAIAVWLNRDQILNDSDVHPDIEINSLTELSKLLAIPAAFESHKQ